MGIQPNAGPSLLFITLPNVFQQAFGGLPWLAIILSIMFYVLLALAALTSTISLHEVVTAYLHEEFNMTRSKAARLVTAGCIVLGALCSLPLGGFFIALFSGWYLDKKIMRGEFTNNGTVKIGLLLAFILKYIAPIGIAFIFINELGLLK